MPAFALPQAVSPRVAATLSRFAHYPVLDRVYQRARTYDITPMAQPAGRGKPQGLPEQLTLIFDGRDRSKPTQLHYGRLPVHPRFWSYDANRGILSYNFKSDGVDHIGSLTFAHAASSAIGTLSVDGQHVGVKAVLAPVSYSCDVALNTGASATGVAPALNLHWDATDPRWSSATWIKDALTFTWQVTGQVVVGQPTYNIAVSFADQQTNTSWKPAPDTGDISALLDANYNFTLTLAGGDNPPADDRSKLPSPASGVASVFPYLLGFMVSNDGSEITGALLTGQASQAGTVLGLRGTVVNPSAAGLYSTSASSNAVGAIAVYGGRLHINDTPVETSSLTGSRLTWSGLTTAEQQHSGLPASGALMFSADGAQFRAAQGGITGRRLRPEQVARQYSGTPIVDHPAIATGSALSATPTLSLQSLASMTQFAFVNNAWVDVVQQATMNDFNQILLYYMPNDMRQTYYNVSPPILPTWLQAIAAQGTDPAAAYQSLATAYLTNILSHFDEAGANQLNAARAVTWLKSQTAANPVLQQQTTAIYAQEFVNKPENAALPQYLQDQGANASTYAQFIQNDAAQWQQELAQTIQDAKSLATMQQLATELSQLAQSQNLYWAYAFFRYLTTPAQLMIIQLISLGVAIDLDGSAFMRRCQTNAALLTQLDPSNVFSREYVKVIQLFQLGNVLPTLFDLGNTDPDDFVFDIQLVLNQIAKNYQGNSDPDVQDAVAEAEALAGDQKLREYVVLVQSIAASNAGLAAWDTLAPRIESRLGQLVGAKATGLFMMALAGVGLMGLINGSLQWKSLSPTQRATLIAGGAAFAIELVCAIVKRGVAIAAVWSESSIRVILKGLMTGDIFKAAYQRLDNGFQDWIVKRNADVAKEGELRNLTKRLAVFEGEEGEALFGGAFDLNVAEKIFGKNLDEFVATRIGAFISVVFLVLSIIDAVEAGDPLERMADGWMAASAGLDLIAAVAGWALGAAEIATVGGVAVASICSAIGFLGILAALVGVAILLYMIFRPQKNPVQQFGSDYAQPAGFFMPYGSEVDNFIGYTQGTGEPARVGCSFVVDANAGTVLSVASDGTTVEAAAQSYGCSSVFVISTNGNGQSQVMASVPNSSGGLNAKVLTWAANNTVSFQPPLRPTDNNYDMQLWSSGMQAPPQMDGSFPEAGTFLVVAWGTTSALVWNGTKLVLGSGPNWTIEQEPMAPAGLSMGNIKLYTFSRGQSFRPALLPGASLPQTWSVEPALPSFLTLDTTSGRMSQTATTQDLPVTPPTQYRISVTNDVGTAPTPATFTIEVDTLSLS